MQLRGKKLRVAIRRAVLLTLALCLLALSGGRFGFRTVLTQCPTAPVQEVAIMTKQADGSYLREVRAPRPGEKDFVVCNCQAKRSSTQTGWFVPPYPLAILAATPRLNIPLINLPWDQPELAISSTDPPTRVEIHPPTA